MAIPIRREGEYAVFTGADGKEIRYPIAELRAALRKKPAEREITCPDINKFNQFYANIIREPDPNHILHGCGRYSNASGHGRSV